jgi:segregation and condensation protein B
MGKGEGDSMSNVAEMRVIVGGRQPDELQEERAEELRILEALLFAAEGPLDEKALAARLPAGADIHALLMQLQTEYAPRGVNLVRVAGKWTLRTANDLAWLLTHETTVTRKLSRAAIETLAIVAYHQPVTRAEIEEIRGVTTSKGTLDVLLETGWIRLRGRRKAPGRPVTYGTNEAFLSHFGLEALTDLPGLDELKGAGLIEAGSLGRSGLARGRGPARAGRPRSRARSAAGAQRGIKPPVARSSARKPAG